MAKTQKQAVLEHLEKYGTITSFEAFNFYGATRLSSIIYDLKHRDGYNIVSENITVKTRYGRNVGVSEYRLEH